MDYLERIAVLETEKVQMKTAIDEMNTKLDTLIDNMNRMKGFWAGAVAAGTALGAVLSYAINYILQLKGG